MSDRNASRDNFYSRQRTFNQSELLRHCAAVHGSNRPVDSCGDCAHLDSRVRAGRRREIEKGRG